MDYLNYRKEVKPQSQPQGFSENIQLTKEDFSFGDLSLETNQPPTQLPTQPKTEDELMQMFPTPILICRYTGNFDKELEWIRNQKCNKDEKSDIYNQYNRQSEDTFLLDRPELSNIRVFIEQKINIFVKEIMGSSDNLVITQSWLNKSGKGESHHEHVHPNSMVSGVWYPQINENLPPIRFKNRNQRDISFSHEKYNIFNSATFMLPMKKGELILFPSDLQHSVPVNPSDEERISLSFNTWPKGNLGSKKQLTYLPLDRCV